jgi:branched-chain amino acid aminotransferase
VVVIADRLKMYPPAFYEHGLAIVTTSTRRNSPAALDPGIKSLNYLNNILAKIEVNRAGAGEGLMLNAEGAVAEATGDNVFIVKNGRVATPPPHVGILEGITRATVIDLCGELGIPCDERIFNLLEVYTADECFLTGTGAEVIPVVKVDDRTIGDGAPGPLTGRLIAAFRALVHTTGVPID